MIKFDIDSWNRKGQFDFFSDYEDPFFNITVAIEAHHALIDAYHVGKFVTLYQETINQL